MTETGNHPLAKDFHGASLLAFALPSMVMMLFMGLYTLADTLFVARFVGTAALSSINIVCPVINLIVGLGTMLATGGSAIVARKMGRGDLEEARRNFTLLVVTGAIVGLVITAVGLLFLEEIVWGLGASEILFPYCRDYLGVQLFFAVGNMLQVLYQNLFVTAGRPGLGMALCVLAGVANLVFDFIFLAGMGMGIAGAALGTGIGYLIPTLVGTGFFFTGKSKLHFQRPRPDGSVLLESCSNGLSEMVSQLSTAVTTFLFNAVMMRLLGEDGVAAITVIIYSQFLLTTLIIGFSMGVAPVISYQYGGGNGPKLRKIIRVCFGFVAALSLLAFLVSFRAGEGIAWVFASGKERVFQITKTGFAVFSFAFLFSGCNVFASALFTALSNGKASAAISFCRTFGLITVFLLALPRIFQVMGVWLAVPLAELGTLMLTVGLLYRHRRDFFI